MYFLGSYLPIKRITSRLYNLMLHWLLLPRTLLLIMWPYGYYFIYMHFYPIRSDS